MWENAAPLPENEPPRPPARCAGSEEDLVLWAQILLCLAAIGLVLAAGALDWPVYPELRRAFTAAMQPEQSLLLGEERNLLKFTEQTAGELVDSARSMWEDFTLPATPESARTAHGQPSPPAYARTDSYTPGFPLQFPLPGQSRKTSGYGWRTDPMGGLGDDFHIGNDLAAAQGTPVLAAADGVARMAGSHKSYGNYLRILHADGDETLYAHMQYLFVKAGSASPRGRSSAPWARPATPPARTCTLRSCTAVCAMTPPRPCRMRRSRAKIRWKQPLLTLAALTLLLAFDGSGILRVGLGCAVLHECGHALAYRLFWRRWPEIEVSPFGLCLRLRGLPMTNLQELLLAAAGPAVNLLACAAVLAFMRATAYTYGGYWFACCNLLVGASNLLPLPGLDGAHIAACLLHFGRK